jgi:hypothetical protein
MRKLFDISYTNNCFKAPIISYGVLSKKFADNNANLITNNMVIPRNYLSKYNYAFYTDNFNNWSLGKCSISNQYDDSGKLISSSVSSSYYVNLYKNKNSTTPIGWCYHSTNLFGNVNTTNSEGDPAISILNGKESVTYCIEENNNNNNTTYGLVSENVLVMKLNKPIDNSTTIINISDIDSYQTSFPGILDNGETSIAFQQFITSKKPNISLSCKGYLKKIFANEAQNKNEKMKNIINLTGIIQVYRWNSKDINRNFKYKKI